LGTPSDTESVYDERLSGPGWKRSFPRGLGGIGSMKAARN
jgi:hypothetical protein